MISWDSLWHGRSKLEKSILFYRDYQEYTGGHQKVADYLAHAQSSNSLKASIAFSERSLWAPPGPWGAEYEQLQVDLNPKEYDYLFMAGMDWQPYLAAGINPDQPVLNLIQGVRHAQIDQNVYPFLRHKAVRICVSQEVSAAIQSTGLVNGPVFTIPNGHGMPEISNVEKCIDILVVGSKRPDLAKALGSKLSKMPCRIDVLSEFIPRGELLSKMAASRICVLLPSVAEGFYLPALEAMKYCDLTIVPDCVGNRGFCHHEFNCLVPEYSEDAVMDSCHKGIRIINCEESLASYRLGASSVLAKHTLKEERQSFLRVIERLDVLWEQAQ